MPLHNKPCHRLFSKKVLSQKHREVRSIPGDLNINSLSDELLKSRKLVETVLGGNILVSKAEHALEQLTKGSNAVSLSNTQDGGVDVGSASFESSVSVGGGATSVVVEVSLNVTSNHLSQRRDLVIDLTPGGASNGISDSHAVSTETVHEGVQLEDLAEVRAERVFTREANLEAVGLGELNDLLGLFGNPVEVLSVGVLHKLSRSADAHVDSVDACFNGEASVVHVASNVDQDLCLETHLANSLGIGLGLWGGSR
jgi:hypothetical protein